MYVQQQNNMQLRMKSKALNLLLAARQRFRLHKHLRRLILPQPLAANQHLRGPKNNFIKRPALHNQALV
jgi:hypothetical protein